MRKHALEARRARLEPLVSDADAILFSEAIASEGGLVFAKACEMGLEGIVSKRLGGLYWSGRCKNWLKVKNPAFQRNRTGSPTVALVHRFRETNHVPRIYFSRHGL